MPAWTIQGETGRTLDGDGRTLAALGIESAVLTFRTLAEDELVWSAPAATPDLSDLLIPDLGQQVSLWDGAERKFIGHVVSPRANLKGLSVTAAGPWWWLEQTTLASEREDETGTTAQRPTYVFPSQPLGVSLRALVNAAAAAGLPVATVTRDHIPDLYQVPQISLSLQSFADGISELLAWCPDAVAWWDYATGHDAANHPRLYIRRRAQLQPLTYTVGIDPLGDATEIEPVYAAQVSGVTVTSARRNSTSGATSWETQSAGAPAGASAKVQIIPVSGPELGDFVPGDDIEPPEDSGLVTDFDAWAKSEIAALQGGGAVVGPQSLYRAWAYASAFNANCGPDPDRGTVTEYVPARTYQNNSGQTLPTSQWEIWDGTIDSVPDGYSKVEGKVSFTWGYLHAVQDPGCTYGTAGPVIPPPAWVAGVTWYREMEGYLPAGFYRWYFSAQEISCVFVQGSPTSPSIAYDYTQPPADLAANLLSAQSWLPWTGSIELVGQADGQNLLGRKYNLEGAWEPAARANALASEIEHDLSAETTRITLGTPARHDYRTLVNRVRRSGQDNIVWL